MERKLKHRMIVAVLALLFGFVAANSVLAQAGSTKAVLFQKDEAAESSQDTQPGVRLLESDQRGALLEVGSIDYQLEEVTLDGETCTIIRVAGAGETQEPGSPRLPVIGTMIGLPPSGNPKTQIEDQQWESVFLSYGVCPVSRPIVEQPLDGKWTSGGEMVEWNPAAYGLNAFDPQPLAEISLVGMIRSQRMAQLRFQPFQYNPVTRELRVFRLKASLDFGSEAASLPAGIAVTEETSFESVLSASLLNYAEARSWRVSPSVSAGNHDLDSSPASQPALKAAVSSDGLYRVTYADFLAAGAPVEAIDPRKLQAWMDDQPVAIRVSGEADGSLDPGDFVLFYGQAIDSRYTDERIYWLTWGDEPALRMAEASGAPQGADLSNAFTTTLHLEQDRWYFSSLPSGPDNDLWYGSYVYGVGSPASTEITFTLQDVVNPLGNALMRGLLKSYGASPQHHTLIYLNGHLIEDLTWPASSEVLIQVDVPDEYLVNGTNSLVVEAPMDNGISYDVPLINWFDIDYSRGYAAGDEGLFFEGDLTGEWEFLVTSFATGDPQVLDISSPLTPTWITNTQVEPGGGNYSLRFRRAQSGERRYLALTPAQYRNPRRTWMDTPSNLHAPEIGADYIILTHADFVAQMQPLAALRRDQGLRVALIDVQDVYDEFGGGMMSAEAIHDFLAYAYSNWVQPGPTFVLLVGDGSYDFKDAFGLGNQVWMPPYLASVDPWMGETAADNRFVTISGEDLLPDMHIGRLPARSPVEASTMISKILEYETTSSDAEWLKRGVFIADNPDQAGNFYEQANAIASEFFPEDFVSQKIYYGDNYPTPEGAKAAILQAWNDGALLVNYFGHSAVQWWAGEKLLTLPDVGGMTNAGKYPVVLPMTCLEGYYIEPDDPEYDFSSVGESIVRKENGGAIASWSPAGFGVATGHDFLIRGFYGAIFHQGITQVGPATTAGKIHLYANTSGYRDLLDTYLLFGDPAMRLKGFQADLGISKQNSPQTALQSGSWLTYTLAFSNTGNITATGVVLTDAFPLDLVDESVVVSGVEAVARPGSRYIWDISDLGPGAAGKLTLTARVRDYFTGVISNTAEITTASYEVDLGNNQSATVYNGVNVADLRIEKTGPAQVEQSGIITYTLQYGNLGSVAVEGVTIQDLLPAALLTATYSFEGPQIQLVEGSHYQWEVAHLEPGETGTITITGWLAPDFWGKLINSSEVSSSEPDGNPMDNSSSWETDVLPFVVSENLIFLPIVQRME